MIIWLLFILVCAYNYIDIYQTYLLFQCGAVEVNPVLLIFMSDSQDITTIIIIKTIVISILGVLLYLRNKIDGRY